MKRVVLSQELFIKLKELLDVPDDTQRMSIHLAVDDVVRVEVHRVPKFDADEVVAALAYYKLIEEVDDDD